MDFSCEGTFLVQNSLRIYICIKISEEHKNTSEGEGKRRQTVRSYLDDLHRILARIYPLIFMNEMKKKNEEKKAKSD